MAKVLSIEIGNALTRICEMDYRVKSPKIYKYVSIPTPAGTIDDGFIVDGAALAGKLKVALSENKMRTKQVVFSVTSGRIATREVFLPAVKKVQIDSLVKANAADYFPIDLTEYELAHLMLGIDKQEGQPERYKLMVMAANKSLIDGYEKFAAQAGLRMVALDYSANSIYQIMRNECKDDTEMVIKVEEKSTFATVLNGQNLLMQRNIPYGVEDAIQAVMRNHVQEQKNYDYALDLLKRKTCIRVVLSESTQILEDDDVFDESAKAKAFRTEVTYALESLVSNVSRIVDLYNSKNTENPIKRIRLVGLGSDISGLSKLFTNELGIRTTVMNNLESIDWDRAAGEGNPGRYIASIGAAIAPVGFVNEEKKKKDAKDGNYKTTAVLLAIFCVVVALALTVLALAEYNEALEEQQRLQRLEAEYAPAENVYNTYNNLIAFYKEVENGYKLTEHPNDQLIAFLEELEDKLPADAVLTDFTSDGTEAVLTLKVRDKETAARVFQVLRGFDSLMDVSVGSLDQEDIDDVEEGMEEGEPTFLFSVHCSYYPIVAEESATPAN